MPAPLSQRGVLTWGPSVLPESGGSSLSMDAAIPHGTTWVLAGGPQVLRMNAAPEVYPVTAGVVLSPIAPPFSAQMASKSDGSY